MQFPEYPHWIPLEIHHRDAVCAMLRNAPPRASELTFTNLFIWRHHYGFEVCRIRSALLVRGRSQEDVPMLLPSLGPPLDPHLLREVARDQGEGGCIARADGEWLARHPGLEAMFRIVPERDHFDYLYSSRDLIRLAGRKYHRKRNHLNRFLKTYSFEYRPLTPDLIDACLEVAHEWCRERECAEHPALKGEEQAIGEALRNWTHLHCEGGVLMVEGRVKAFALGEELNPDTAVIHIEKADARIEGIYTAICQQFVKHRWAEKPFINREQDMGEPNLRKSKESYYPCALVEKYRLEPLPDGRV